MINYYCDSIFIDLLLMALIKFFTCFRVQRFAFLPLSPNKFVPAFPDSVQSSYVALVFILKFSIKFVYIFTHKCSKWW